MRQFATSPWPRFLTERNLIGIEIHVFGVSGTSCPALAVVKAIGGPKEKRLKPVAPPLHFDRLVSVNRFLDRLDHAHVAKPFFTRYRQAALF